MKFKYLDKTDQCVSLPQMIRIKQKLIATYIEKIDNALRREFNGLEKMPIVKEGENIAIAVGSRGMAGIVEMVRFVVAQVKTWGGNPYIIPAMGSHGGATSEGQRAILSSLGITPENVNSKIDTNVEADEIGFDNDGFPVYFSRAAKNADGIIVINRVKVHTDFRNDIESGLMKLLVIGLGKKKGAKAIHKRGLYGLKKGIPMAAKVILECMPIRLGIATIENAYKQVADIKVILPENFFLEEKKLLKRCRSLLPYLPFKKADILIVEEFGKEISGTGMDTNVIGRLMINGEQDFNYPFIRRIVVLNLTDYSHGNCSGLGLADFTTEKVYNKIDLKEFYINSLTGAMVERAKIPMIMCSDEEAIKAAVLTSWAEDPGKVKIAKIKNTSEIGEMQVSKALLTDILSMSRMAKNIEVIEPWEKYSFSDEGELLLPKPLKLKK